MIEAAQQDGTDATASTGVPVIHQLTDTLFALVADEDVLPPDVCPEVVPVGYSWTGEVMDFEFTDGDWREVYILERVDE